MGSISIVHGIIKVEDINLYKKVVESIERDENYPWIRPEMLNLCEEETPYYYESPIATFGATYKNLDGGISWSEFILKFEHLLTLIKFDFARIRLETAFMGDYEFFWGAKRGVEDEFYSGKDLIESDNWFFGYGTRHMFGGLEEQEPKLPFDFQYPVEFNQPIKEKFNSILPELNKLELRKRTFFDDWSKHKVFGNDHSHLILTYLKINKVLRFGWESSKGFFIVRLKEIKKIETPYN
ncbi:hypothetical protein LVD15_22700 [Fulvivirga maritima]|uniref:hypothetical protein n=1 Tax=Fulvivirga maritima TaxID=2904247 RepID=UPI001F485803|nr:hypothetical protein [Fulvivirga maritima]UII26083.1 hypothetical protein LVD15_22700 [Fulvivirga maritima]